MEIRDQARRIFYSRPTYASPLTPPSNGTHKPPKFNKGLLEPLPDAFLQSSGRQLRSLFKLEQAKKLKLAQKASPIIGTHVLGLNGNRYETAYSSLTGEHTEYNSDVVYLNSVRRKENVDISKISNTAPAIFLGSVMDGVSYHSDYEIDNHTSRFFAGRLRDLMPKNFYDLLKEGSEPSTAFLHAILDAAEQTGPDFYEFFEDAFDLTRVFLAEGQLDNFTLSEMGLFKNDKGVFQPGLSEVKAATTFAGAYEDKDAINIMSFGDSPAFFMTDDGIIEGKEAEVHGNGNVVGSTVSIKIKPNQTKIYSPSSLSWVSMPKAEIAKLKKQGKDVYLVMFTDGLIPGKTVSSKDLVNYVLAQKPKTAADVCKYAQLFALLIDRHYETQRTYYSPDDKSIIVVKL